MDFAPSKDGISRVAPYGVEDQVNETEPDYSVDSKHVDAGDASSSGVPWAPSRGVLRLSRFNPGGSAPSPAAHRSTYVNGPDYCGMTDNDIRGFLDGGFIWGWNQATQIHVRLGRTGEHPHPQYGENELFRVLYRWADIDLPDDVEVSACRLTLHVEEGPARPLRLLVYAVSRSWNPGGGGVDGNNVSVPKPGEVWWGDAAFEGEGWSHPGAGFASDSHAEADTGAHALAEAVWRPGDDDLVFESTALSSYAAERVRRKKPLLLLLKLTDAQEDTEGCFFNLYSGEHGDSRNTVRRPSLALEWSSPSEVESVSHQVFLEYGRVWELPKQRAGSGHCMASFEADPGYAVPIVQVREGTGDTAGAWHGIAFPFEPRGEWFQVRLLAMPDPVELGQSFVAELADTWVLTGPPERQSVLWSFESPSGASHSAQAEYLGRYRWRAELLPDELGTWRYRWTQDFLPERYLSAVGEFCVWASNLDQVMRHLAQLEKDVSGASRDVRRRLRPRLHALERAGMRLLTPDEYRGAGGERFRAAIRGVRSALWGKAVPVPIPMRSHSLVREIDGVELRDPIPEGTHYGAGLEDDGRAGKPGPGPARRLRRLVSRVLGSRGGRSS